MRILKVKIAAFILALSLAVSLVAQVPVAAGKGKTILEFDTMVAVTGPYVGTANPIRGINGGGLPWKIENGNGELQANGHLEVHVRGLVLAAGPRAGTNPVADFKAIVSCLSISNGSPTTVNVSTGLFPATMTGDAEIETQITLPSPCIAPLIFVTSPTGSWFAATGD
ncbi:MAG TPA: hypothetical protein VKX96_10775 [Chloroflexota bacterium]|nr:hypothetical protein [Chloroflexota bacterium]